MSQTTLMSYKGQLWQFIQERDIQDTSIEAYRKIRVGLKGLYGKIITLLESNPDGLSINEIGDLLKIQNSTISARVNELRSAGIIKLLEDRNSSISGFRNKMWTLSPKYKDLVELID